MEDFFKELIGKAHPLVVDFILIVIGVVVIVWIWSMIQTLKHNTAVYATSDKLIQLQNEYNQLNNNNNILRSKYSQSRATINGIRRTYSELKYILYLFSVGSDIKENSQELLRSITERVANDIKYNAGEIHRCAIWFNLDDLNLAIAAASSGFPEHYRFQKSLDIDRSIAGRVYRTKTTINSGNVRNDRDYVPNPSSTSRYYSMICAPLVFGNFCFGVITVDGKEENAFLDEDVETIETYAEIVSMLQLMTVVSTDGEEEDEVADEETG